MRVADAIARILAERGVQQVFMVTGGGAMHLNDAIGRRKDFAITFCHHEQACSMAAESYARLNGQPALVNVTTGPGGINALNGVYGAYVDSIPMLVVSGQVKRETLVTSYDLPVRQIGDQEVNIIEMAKPVCKWTVQLTDPLDVKEVVERAFWIATHGRPGPVWIDVPIDVQASPIDWDSLRNFNTEELLTRLLPASEQGLSTGEALREQIREMYRRLSEAERPVILAGAGVRISGMHREFLSIVDKLGIPVTSGWNAHDVIWDDHPLFVGRPGTVGDRAGNFAVQNADLLIVLGSRLNIRQIGYNFQAFARNAFKVMVDIDQSELDKPTLAIDQKIHADLADAFDEMLDQDYPPRPEHREYLKWCKERQSKYPVVLSSYDMSNSPINPYTFVDRLFDHLREGDVVVTGDGTACVVTFQAAKLKRDQRLYTNSGSASMGYDLPAAIGAAMAKAGERVICIAGDGSIMMNLQELQTIFTNKLNIKIFVLSNGGYSSIRQTQENYFSDNIVGCGPESGISFPNFAKIAESFGIDNARCLELCDLDDAIALALHGDSPYLLDLNIDPNQPFSPKLASRQLPDGTMVSPALEDQWPFLSRTELASNMLVDFEASRSD
jgi:acetolactate synthase-1/2/3 large subunit